MRISQTMGVTTHINLCGEKMRTKMELDGQLTGDECEGRCGGCGLKVVASWAGLRREATRVYDEEKL